MRRIVLVVAVLIAGAAGADTTGRVFSPAVDDAYVLSSEAGASHPDGSWLLSGAGSAGVYRSFARFPLPRGGQIVSAVLKMGYAGAESSLGAGEQLIDFVPDDAWSQTTLTWNDQPGVGERVATIEKANLGDMSIDVTQLAQREQSLDGWLSLRISGANEAVPASPSKVVRWSSRDGADQRGFHLDLIVSPAPAVRRGDVVVLSTDGLFKGVVAIDPSERVLRGVAPIRFVIALSALGVDPRDGSLVGVDDAGVVRMDRSTGNPTALFDYAQSSAVLRPLAMASDAHAYATDESDRVIRIDLDTGARDVVSAGGALCRPIAMAIDGVGLVVSDSCGKLVRIDPGSGVQSIVPTGGPLLDPDGIAIEADGSILVADTGGSLGRVVRIDPFAGTQTVLSSLSFVPGPIAVGPDGTIWVASRWWQCVGCEQGEFGSIDPQLGAYTRMFRRWDSPTSIAIDRDGAPLLALTHDFTDAYVDRFDPETGHEAGIAAPLGLPFSFSSSSEDAHYHLFVEANGQLLVVTDARVMRVDPATGTQSLIARIDSAGCDPDPACLSSDVALAPDGKIVLLRTVHTSHGTRSRLVWIDPAGGAFTFREIDRPLSSMDRIAIEAGGALLLSLSYGPTISRFDPVALDVSSTIDLSDLTARVDDMALDASGTLFVADAADNEILRVDSNGGTSAVVGSSPAPGRLVVDAFGRVISWSSAGCYPCQEILSILDPASGSRTTLVTNSELGANHTLAVLEPACADHLDDDGDGLVDLADPGCANAHSPRENPQCDNGRDDDHDGRIDLADPDCTSPASTETACGLGAELTLVLAALSGLRARIRPIRR